MTTIEFSNQFDIQYDNIASKGAPGLDLYEKSIYLTRAQLELIKDKYTPLGNKYQKGFENGEKRIIDLKKLIKSYQSNSFYTNNENISDTSKFIKLPEDIYLIIYEHVEFDSENECYKNKKIKVVPKTHDEYNIQINNPFKKPSGDLVWRLNLSDNENSSIIELESFIPLKTYYCRYIIYPKPIILTNLDSGDFIEMGLSIDGFTNEQTSELHKGVHQEILDRAVELAVADYKDGTLQSKVQLDLRNE